MALNDVKGEIREVLRSRVPDAAKVGQIAAIVDDWQVRPPSSASLVTLIEQLPRVIWQDGELTSLSAPVGREELVRLSDVLAVLSAPPSEPR